MPAFPGLSMSQKMQAVTVKMQAISQKVQAVWSQWPFHVEHLKVMNKQQERSYTLLVALWIGANLYFWIWWLQGSHIGNPVLYGLMCLSLLYEGTVLVQISLPFTPFTWAICANQNRWIPILLGKHRS
ncbi:hypothetical protein [Ktedonobacter racemifer]|uniref:hypothetical protein n=1 Tax=Ktedonobacter racemifer TaxID=363277 RepID=UPI00058B76DB|nr:hypothetical protein [Ktedonobacter racemifer]